MAKKHHISLRLVKVIAIIFTVIVAVALVYSAFGGRTDPKENALGSIAVLAYPFLLGLAVFLGLMWVVVRRWLHSIVVWVAILLTWPTFSVVCPFNIKEHKYTAQEDSTKFKVLTFNVENFHVKYSGDDKKDMEDASQTIRYILDQDADVVLLQEASLSTDFNNLKVSPKLMKELKTKYPYRDHGYHDQVIWSKHPYEPVVDDSIKNGFASPDDPVSNYHFAARAFDVLIPGHSVRFFNLHLQSLSLSHEDRQFYENITNLKAKTETKDLKQSSKSIYSKLKTAFVKHTEEAKIIRQVIDLSDENVIVCGDFNDVPASYAYRMILGNDLADAWVKCGFAPTTTFNSNHLFFKIDHMMYRGDMQAVEIHRDKAGCSDHYPLVTTFVWKR